MGSYFCAAIPESLASEDRTEMTRDGQVTPVAEKDDHAKSEENESRHKIDDCGLSVDIVFKTQPSFSPLFAPTTNPQAPSTFVINQFLAHYPETPAQINRGSESTGLVMRC